MIQGSTDVPQSDVAAGTNSGLCPACGIGQANRSGLCKSCFLTQLGKSARKYIITPQALEELRLAYMGNRTEVTAKLRRLSSRTEIPTWALKNEANKQGWHCCPQRRRWTGEEENLLREKLGAVSVNSIAKRLGRKRASVEDKAREFGLSVRISEGYTLSDLAGVFGVHKGTAKRWAERGLLGKAHQQQGSAIRVTDSNVRRFIWSYPHEYNLTRVDQIWFKSMVFGSLAAAGSECK